MKSILIIALTLLSTTTSFGANQTVMNTNDSGTGSLREAITLAGNGDTVFFDINIYGSTIVLTTELNLFTSIVIQGPAIADMVTISGGGVTRIFNVTNSNAVISVEWLKLKFGIANRGGVAYNIGTLHFDHCRLFSNTAVSNSTNDGGGAIFNNSGGIVNANYCEFYDNKVITTGPLISLSAYGGAILSQGIRVVIDNCSFYDNSVFSNGNSRGGAIYSATPLYISTSTISGNKSIADTTSTNGGSGGSIFTLDSLIITSSTFTGGEASGGSTGWNGWGGNIFSNGVLEIRNSIVANGIAELLPDLYQSSISPMTSLGNNLIMDTSFFYFFLVSSDITGDPQLDTLFYNNTAFTKTHALLCGSPAFNTGNNTNASTTDQADQGRIFDGTIDIGSYEAQTDLTVPIIPIVSQSGSDLTTGIYTTYQWYLDGNIIAGATSQTITPSGNGNYTVEVSNGLICSALSTEFNVSNVGIDENSNSKLFIYPNPATSVLNIESEIFTEISIYSNLGQEIQSFDLSLGKNTVDVSSLADGLYIIQLSNKSSYKTTSFIKN